MAKSLDGELNGLDLFGEPIRRKTTGPVAERFFFPPFSVLDARAGEWQERQRAWLRLGIQGECGRDDAANGVSRQTSSVYLVKRNDGSYSTGGSMVSEGEKGNAASVFSPVVCELAYRWFCPDGGQVLDPFAGGSVRGVVAGMLGRKYWGSDLREEQIAANRQQAADIAPEVTPEWVCGDSAQTLALAPAADFLFSCPPYGDLEKYSDNPADLSAMAWGDFTQAYSRIIGLAVARLKNDRFACFVVGDFRDERGLYRDFVSSTVAAFRAAGAALYNEAILVTPVGSACMRVSKQFAAGRKLAKTHQNVLVFCKGDWRKAAAALKEE